MSTDGPVSAPSPASAAAAATASSSASGAPGGARPGEAVPDTNGSGLPSLAALTVPVLGDLGDGPAASASAPSQANSRKRSPDDLSLLCELPPREAEAVALALEQWARLRLRVKALEPTLRREGALVQEILDTGLRDENRRTLRKLTQSSAGGDEETIQQVGKAIGANRERLERILERNHGELVRLSTTAVSDMKEDVLREVDEVLSRLKHALSGVRGELLCAKERADMTAVRRTGRSFNDLKGLVRRLDEERRLITRNSALAALLVTVCRRVLPVRQVDPAALRDIPASCEGYRRIMDFYFFTDAGLYFFGDYPSGPNWFVRLKRNVAILLVRDASGRVLYNHFAVSGEHRAPGAPLAPDCGPLRSIEAQDEHGRVFNRQHDAEFKLLSGFCSSMSAALSAGSNGAAAVNGAAAAVNGAAANGNGAAANGVAVNGLAVNGAAVNGTAVNGAAANGHHGGAAAWGQQMWRQACLGGAKGTLWSRKPLCESCRRAVQQVKALFPELDLHVSEGSLGTAPSEVGTAATATPSEAGSSNDSEREPAVC